MSEFKFACGQCGQHIAVEEAWSGHPIKCPNCQANLVVPQFTARSAPPPVMLPSPPPLSSGTQHSAPPSIPQAGLSAHQAPVPRAEVPVKFWLLALASPALMLLVIPLTFIGIMVTKSWLGGLVSLLACIPALLCSQAALAERDLSRGVKESQLSGVGAGFAWAGRVLGFIWLGLTLFGFCRYSYYKISGTPPPQSRWSYASPPQNSGGQSFTPTPNSKSAPPAPARPARPAKSAEPPVTTDPRTVTIPDLVPSGTVLGAAYNCTGIHYSGISHILDFDQGNAANPQASIKIFLLGRTTALAGQSIIIPPEPDPNVILPHVHLKGSTGRADAVMSGYVLRLEFSQPDSKGVLTGHLYLELQPSYATKVSGTFKIAAQ